MRADELAEEAQRIKEDNQAKKDKLKEEIMLAKEVKERLRKKRKKIKGMCKYHVQWIVCQKTIHSCSG